MKKIIVLFLALLFSMSGCEEKKNSLLDKDSFAILSAKTFLIRYSGLEAEQKSQLIKQLFLDAGVSAQDYLKTKAYYAQEPYFWEAVYKKINAYLSTIQPDSVAHLFLIGKEMPDKNRSQHKKRPETE